MESLIVLLFLPSIAIFFIQLNIIDKAWATWTWLGISFFYIYLMHSYAIEQSYTSLQELVTNQTIITNFVIVQILEALVGLLLVTSHNKYATNHGIMKYLKYFIFFPGVVVFIAFYYMESLVFLSLSGYNFRWVAGILSLVVPGLLLILRYFIKYLIPQYDLLLEAKFYLHVIQMVIAIVISVFILKLPVQSPELPDMTMPVLVMVALLIVCMGSGVIVYNYKTKKMLKNIKGK